MPVHRIAKRSGRLLATNGATPNTIGIVYDTDTSKLVFNDGTNARVFSEEALSTQYGTVNGATVSAVERGDLVFHQTVLTMAATPVSVSDTNVGGGVKIYTFPEGRILLLGATGTSAITTTSTLASTLNTGVTCNWGLGSVITTTQGSGTLATTQVDMLPSTNITASATINVAGAASNGKLASSIQFDGTTTASVVNWNIGVAGATDIDGDATITVAATITLTWAFLGDY